MKDAMRWKNTAHELPPEGEGCYVCDESGFGIGVYEGGRWFNLATESKREMPHPPKAWFIPEPPAWIATPQLRVVK